MSMYMLLLYDDPKAWAKISPDEMQKAIEKYRAWRAKPFTKDSNRLGDDAGRVIRSTNGKGRVADGPYSETSVRGQLLADLGRAAEAATSFEEALACACSEPEQRFL